MAARWLDLAGRVALVTAAGASGGIGHATALALAEAGADLFVCDIDGPGAAETAREVAALGRRCEWAVCDFADPEAIGAMVGALDRAFPQIDILVNNVGVGHRARPEDLTLAGWRQVIAVNLDGTFVCTQAIGRRMIARGRGGSIVNIASIAGSSALGRGNFVYSVTKAGIIQFTRDLALEWARHGIRVNAIQPAQIMTPALEAMFADPRLDPQSLHDRLVRGIPLDRLGRPDDVARAAVFLASDGASFITGHCLAVDGGNLAMNAGGSKAWEAERAD